MLNVSNLSNIILPHSSFAAYSSVFPVFVTSRLDYCNSLFHNIAIKDITKLQRIQTCLARVVTRSPRFTPSKPLLMYLHWLPIQYRKLCKIFAITYQTFSSKQPSYLHALLTPIRKHVQQAFFE